MAIIPQCYAQSNETFITVPALKRFLRDIDEKCLAIRADLIASVEQHAATSPENAKSTLKWLDSTLKEGITELHTYEYEVNEIDTLRLGNEALLAHLRQHITDPENPHICSGRYGKDFAFVNFRVSEGVRGKVISLAFAKRVYIYNARGNSATLIFPIFADIYVDLQLFVIRGKSKSNMYTLPEGDFDIETAKATNLSKEIKLAEKAISTLLGITFTPLDKAGSNMRKKLYLLLKSYTKTPKEIQELIDNKADQIQEMARCVAESICCLDGAYSGDVNSDIGNLVEKYFSISYPNKEIFTKDRDAYPLQIVATDEEESKVEQTAALEEPLQSKAVFFDNKKMMQKSEICDGIKFRYLRISPTYFGKQFNVSIQAKQGRMILKFHEFTMEEDIEHVLFSLINA